MKPKSPTLRATIQQFNLIGRKHWWVSFSQDIRPKRSLQFNTLPEARRFALRYVKRANLIVYD